MALTFAGLKGEVQARGFEYLSMARIGRFVNDANHRINDLERWLYLQTVTTGTSPLSISDLGRVESVVDVANRRVLTYMDQRDATDYFADLTQTSGTPDFYYVTLGTVINTFPVTDVTLTVRYLSTQTDLSDETDEPLMPDRFRYAIVEYACAAAFRDASNSQEALVAEQAGDAIVRRMIEWNTLAPGMGPEQRITGTAGDW